ncbi:uncharacterized protein BXZ73DRAFT_100228 [Epithele typhae]|uniref:uncharacterized protein n=1 Tax=Epithele typhae TaxID=378194 RepID=UPI0020076ECD|nr:uncharacterized protein BXZ73DRAFT_100228 [Epithele typhae]KAH9936806.1 hypothetical protein BXZ73DRAFT_100228 [Epithele typhae]
MPSNPPQAYAAPASTSQLRPPALPPPSGSSHSHVPVSQQLFIQPMPQPGSSGPSHHADRRGSHSSLQNPPVIPQAPASRPQPEAPVTNAAPTQLPTPPTTAHPSRQKAPAPTTITDAAHHQVHAYLDPMHLAISEAIGKAHTGLRKELERMHRLLVQQENGQQRLAAQLAQQENGQRTLAAQLAQAEAECARLRGERDAAVRHGNAVLQDSASAQEEARRVNENMPKLFVEYVELKSDHNALGEEVVRLRADNGQLRARLAAAEARIDASHRTVPGKERQGHMKVKLGEPETNVAPSMGTEAMRPPISPTALDAQFAVAMAEAHELKKRRRTISSQGRPSYAPPSPESPGARILNEKDVTPLSLDDSSMEVLPSATEVPAAEKKPEVLLMSESILSYLLAGINAARGGQSSDSASSRPVAQPTSDPPLEELATAMDIDVGSDKKRTPEPYALKEEESPCKKRKTEDVQLRPTTLSPLLLDTRGLRSREATADLPSASAPTITDLSILHESPKAAPLCLEPSDAPRDPCAEKGKAREIPPKASPVPPSAVEASSMLASRSPSSSRRTLDEISPSAFVPPSAAIHSPTADRRLAELLNNPSSVAALLHRLPLASL